MFDKQFLDALQQTDEQWEETTLQKTLARTPERMRPTRARAAVSRKQQILAAVRRSRNFVNVAE